MSTKTSDGLSALQPGSDSGLKGKRGLGVPSITLLIIAASAPLTVMAGGVATTFAVSGVVALPVGFIVLAAALAIFAIGYAAMSRYVTNAGAFYAYISRGLGKPLGVGGAAMAVVSYNMMQIGIYGLFGFQLANFFESKTGIAIPWWVWVLICIGVVALLGVNRIDLSAKVLGVLDALEFAVVIVFDILAFAAAPEGVSTSPLNPGNYFVPGVGAALAFGIASFMGFELAAIYGEEAKDPKRTVARATFAAVTIVGVFYALSAWAFTVGVGPSNIVDASREFGPDLFFQVVTQFGGVILSDISQVLFLTSLFAALQSFHNAVARYFFSMGREGILPRALGATRKRSHAPWVGSVIQTVIAILVIVAFVIAGDVFGLANNYTPVEFLYPVLTLFTWLTTTGAFGLVLLMVLTSVAVVGFFRRNRHSLSVWTTVIAPIISALALGGVFILIMMNFNVLLDQETTNAATFVLPALVLVPGLLGVIYGARLRKNKPEVYARIGLGGIDPDKVDARNEDDLSASAK